jgi:lipid-A-disaccharide synthase
MRIAALMQSNQMQGYQKRILIVAGEASADRYGARLVERLIALHGAEALSFYGTGGDEMQKAGVHLLHHVRELAHIGVREALSSLRTYYKTYQDLLRDSMAQPPALAILIDFPEFNLRLAKRLKPMGIRTIYYIGPQLWAWRSGRVRIIREYVDKMMVILPFEEEYYLRRGVDAEFVGHPLIEGFSPNYDRKLFMSGLNLDPARKTVAILAGSRRKEIDYILPTLLQAAQYMLREIPAQFLISVAPTVEREHVQRIMQNTLNGDPNKNCFRIADQASRDVLANSDFAFVKSGTSSLEAALVGVPFLITYKISPLSWCIGSILIRSSMKGLVNLIAQEKIVPELFQSEAEPERLAQVALEFIRDPEKSASMRSQLAGIRERLSARCASEAVAAAVSSYL